MAAAQTEQRNDASQTPRGGLRNHPKLVNPIAQTRDGRRAVMRTDSGGPTARNRCVIGARSGPSRPAGSRRTRPAGGTRATENGRELQLPSAMNKLLHPRKYFVGKIRPAGRKQRPACCYTYDSYCREPFFRPPPGRYEPSRQASVLPSPGPYRYRGTTPQIRIPIPPSVTVGGKPAGQVTLRLNSINIPVRPRKGRRSMKVAFSSGSPRFRDRDFFPIGGLGSRKTSAARRVRGTSKKSVDDSHHATATGSAGVAGEGEGARALEEKDEGDVVEFLLAHGICKGMRQLPAGPQNRMPTRFFIVPTLSQRAAL
uniref:Uncharacterized protein n=1 Tax=Anopheles dirus TaxID=7168 RepID=A0A182N6A6_9DIPT